MRNTLNRILVALAIGVGSHVFVHTANADLILNFSGVQGSSVFSWEATGSITITTATTGISSTAGRMPLSGSWNNAVGRNIGNAIQNSATSSNNSLLAGGGISFRNNGVEFGIIDTIDLTASTTDNGDDILIDPTSSISYPTLSIGDVVSWAGSGTITLSAGQAYDDFFIPDTYTATIDGGDFEVNIANATAVPEPSSLLLLASASMAATMIRRRQSAG